jgi:hypothetical protein
MLRALGGSVLLLAMTSASLAQDRPRNLAGYETVTLDEAGLEPLPPHPPSDTATSAACAHVARRHGGQATDPSQEAQRVREQAVECQRAASRR